MNLTKQQKILGAVAIFGVCLVAMDQLILGAPESASANVAPDPSALPDTAAPAADQPAEPDSAEASHNALPSFDTLTQRLANAAPSPNDSAEQDPFRLPKEWAPQAVQQVQEVQAAQADTSISSDFLLKQFILDATFRSVSGLDQEQVAVINGRAMHVGDEIVVRIGKSTDGIELGELYQLVKVGSRAVVFESVDSGKQVVLRAPKVLE